MSKRNNSDSPVLRRGRPAQVKTLTSRLRKSKNFHKHDRNLDDYIDRNPCLRSTDKLVLKKLLNLRGRDDSNQVKTTHSGLGKLLDLDRRTIATSLRKLVAEGFLIYEKDAFEPGCNYQKKFYRFPDTFPGFNPSQVFTRRGDAKKAKLREEDRERRAKAGRTQKARFVKDAASPVMSNEAKSTCTNGAGLLDRAFNKVVRKNTSYSYSPDFVAFPSPRLAAPNAEKAASCEEGNKTETSSVSYPSLDAAGEEESQSLPSIVSLQPQFRPLILSVLSQVRKREHIRKIVGFIDYLAGQNPEIATVEDRRRLARDLEQAFMEAFLTDLEQPRYRDQQSPDEPRKHTRGYNHLLDRMYSFFRRFITNYDPAISLNGSVEEDDQDEVPVVRVYDNSILGTSPDFHTILTSILEPAKALDLIPSLSTLIERLVEENGSIVGQAGREEVAEALLEELYKFLLHESHKKILIPRLFRFLHGYLCTFTACSDSGDFLRSRCDLVEEALAELTREFPWLDSKHQMTGRQEIRAKKAMRRLKSKLQGISCQRRSPSICA